MMKINVSKCEFNARDIWHFTSVCARINSIKYVKPKRVFLIATLVFYYARESCPLTRCSDFVPYLIDFSRGFIWFSFCFNAFMKVYLGFIRSWYYHMFITVGTFYCNVCFNYKHALFTFIFVLEQAEQTILSIIFIL